MEIYRNRETSVSLSAPVADAVYSVTVSSPGGLTTTHDDIIPDALGKIEVPIQFGHTLYNGEIVIKINVAITSWETFTIEDYVDVVTPLFTWEDLRNEGYTADSTPELERLVRHVIEAYTGQEFGRRIKRFTISPDDRRVNFDAPLIEFRGVSDQYATLSTTLTPPKFPYEIVDGGFGLSINTDQYDIKTDSFWIVESRRRRSCIFGEGVFGYNRVPQDVKEAALLIAGVWGCRQAVWRDRYIQTMKSADWNVQYDDGAFQATTGSVTADQLLSKYTRRYNAEVI